MSSKMSMVFSQSAGYIHMDRISRRPPPPQQLPSIATAAPLQPPTKMRASSAGVIPTSRSAPRNIKQLFNLGHIMANPGTPCKACGS
jgi:hypothetical protein